VCEFGLLLAVSIQDQEVGFVSVEAAKMELEPGRAMAWP